VNTRRREPDAVSPTELFFDLVFVFAVSQLSQHLRQHLTWRGAAETAVMLVAVFGVWAYTTFAIVHPHGETTVSLSLLLFGGPLLYLALQTGYLRVVTHTPSQARPVGLSVLVAAGGISRFLPPFASLALVAAILTALVVAVLRENRTPR
jgi:low temperature requirement protein LtrA